VTRAKTLWFGWALALMAMAGFTRLGFWQWDRMHEKQALLASVAEVLRDKPVHALDSDVIGGIEWVDGEGQVLPPTLFLDNQMREGRPGVHMYCIVQPDAAAPRRLVDFGWLPIGGDRRMPGESCPTGRQHIRGLSTPLPSSGLKLGPAMQEISNTRWVMTRVDNDAIHAATQIGTLDRVIRLDPTLPGGYARDLDILPNTLPPERHLGYAVQWWALALAVLVTAVVLTVRKTRK